MELHTPAPTTVIYENVTTNFTKNNQFEHKSLELDKSDFMTLALIVIISSIFNTFSIYVICQKRKLRPVDYLVGNLSFCTILMCCLILGMVSLTKMLTLLTIPKQWICSLINFSKYFPGHLGTLASFGISFDRVQSLGGPNRNPNSLNRSRRLSPFKIIGLIWLSSVVISIPTAFTSIPGPVLTQAGGSFSASVSCKRIPLFKSKLADILFEIFKFFFLHLTVSFYLVYEMYLIRSKIKYLCVCAIPGKSLRRKVCRVRFAFIYSLVLIILWITTGSFHLYYKLPIWFSSSSTRASHLHKQTSKRVLHFLRGSLLVYLLVNPVAVFFSNQSIKIWTYICKKEEKRLTKESYNSKDDLNDQITNCDISRFATQQHTTTEDTVETVAEIQQQSQRQRQTDFKILSVVHDSPVKFLERAKSNVEIFSKTLENVILKENSV